jgi:dipeptidyl aminopeptidase/acylaminoacyl peptidase
MRCVLLLLLALGPGTVGAAALKVNVAPDTLVANEEFQWAATLTLTNRSSAGLYLDSLVVVIAGADSGRTGSETTSRRPLALLTAALSAGESSIQSITIPAGVERGRLRFLAWAHDRDNRRFRVEAAAPIAPSAFALAHPSRFFTSGAERCEYVLARPDTAPPGGAPAVLLIHGHGAHARSMMPLIARLMGRGFVAMAVSLRGYGLSGGRPDFMGPATVQALSDGVELLRKEPGVDPRRIGVVGFSRGAACAVSLAARRRDLAAVAAQGGSYDLWATYRQTRVPGLRETIVAEAGSDSAAWRARSPPLEAERIRPPLLVLHGELDDRVPAGPAHALVERRRAAGLPVEARFFPRGGHTLPRGPAYAVVTEFLEKHLKP